MLVEINLKVKLYSYDLEKEIEKNVPTLNYQHDSNSKSLWV